MELVDILNTLLQLDDSIHWFCPRSFDDQNEFYYDEDRLEASQETSQQQSERLEKIDESSKRSNLALQACTIFAFDGSDAELYKKHLKAALTSQLQRCDICIREYYRSRATLRTSLEANYEADEVNRFLEKFDAMNKDRICCGLDAMTSQLQRLPVEQRSINKVGQEAQHALFEALNCETFLRDEDALAQYFDKPFEMVQSKKKIKLANYAPAMIAFLFSPVQSRSEWAVRAFQAVKRAFTGTEFDYSVKPFLEASASRVTVVSLDLEFLPVFWKAVRLIIGKLTDTLITNNLRPLDLNLYTFSMEHWQIDAPHFDDLLTSYQMLLEKSPFNFWDAMGSITSQNVVENIFRSPRFQHRLKARDDGETVKVKSLFGWIEAFVTSLKPANLVPPVRTLLDQLLHKCQDNRYTDYAQTVAWECGVSVLLMSLRLISKLGGGPVVVQLIEVVAREHIQVIFEEIEGIGDKQEMNIDASEHMCLDIVQACLALDIQCLSYSRKALLKTKTLDHGVSISGLAIWKLAMRCVKPGHGALVIAVLSGLVDLLKLEHFTPVQIREEPIHTETWDSAYRQILGYVKGDLLERLASFSSDQLEGIYQDKQAADGMIALMFNGDEEISNVALSIIKEMSNADSRREAMMKLTKSFFTTTLESVAKVQAIIAAEGTFTPAPVFLKLSADIMNCLCDSRDGLLRSLSGLDDAQAKALERFWEMSWTALETIFKRTEPWSVMGYDKKVMQDFCRDTMDFAESAFDQYSIFATSLQLAPNGRNTKQLGKGLLRFPTATFNNITKWLRLRDTYLVNKAVSLTCKMLVRLEQVGIEIDKQAAEFIENIVTTRAQGATIRTNLTMNQKAELQRALEQHLHIDVPAGIDMQSKRQGTLAGWATPGTDSGRSTPAPTTKKQAGAIDVEAWSAKVNAERSRKQADRDKSFDDLISGNTKAAEAWKRLQQSKPSMPATQKAAQKHQNESRDFLAKRKQEQEEARKRKEAALAKQKLGAGSGVLGLGDMGKEHSTKGQNVMVSSDEENEDDSDEDGDADAIDRALFGSTEKRKKGERPNVDPNGAIGLKPEVKRAPTRIHRATRSLRDMRARLAPDLQPLHQVILKWDFFHDGDYPPGANTHIFRPVKNTYGDPNTYAETFEPLLILEAWQNMIKSREENTSKPYEVKIQNRSNVDHFLELSTVVSQQENRELQLSEGDVILFSKGRKPAEDSTAPHCLARISKIKRQKAQMEVVYQVMPGTSLAPSLVQNAQVYGLKIQSLTPLEREYGAMQGLKYYDLCMQIIKAAPSKRVSFSDKQIAAFQDVWNVNRAQSEAINAALENDGFSLIQGPPGSGKTKTIIAIVGGLLSQTLSSSAQGAKAISVPGSSLHMSADTASKKLLVCAPSNAAVDELVMRLKEGVTTKNGKHQAINVVRIGRSEAINSQVLDVTMEELVAKRLGGGTNNDAARAKNTELFKEHESVSATLRELYQKRDSGEAKGEELGTLERQITAARKRKNDLGGRIDNVKDQERNAGREAELNRKRAQQAVLDEAHVICGTLSGSGHDMFQSLNIEFETVIIDEAAQCVEMSSLIPLKYGCVKCIMVGDPKQLPPTVFSKEAAKFQYEQSLFVRMQNNFPDEVHLLDTQYRMHPAISMFPSRTFYDGLLKDGNGMAGLRQRPWHASALLAPYRFYDVQGQHQAAPKGHSLVNVAEIQIAIALFERLTTDFKEYDYTGRIGIITPYKSQLRMLKDRFAERFGGSISEVIEFNTTDAFQGRESEIIIFSCVRASSAGGIGFLQDIRRMNVGLTRAKSSLWVLGNSDSLSRGQYWNKLIEDAKARDLYTTGDLLSMLRKPSSAFPATAMRTEHMYDAHSHVTQMGRDSGSRHPSSSVRDVANIKANGLTGGTTSEGHNSSRAPPPDSDKMEGIRYRFGDRVSKLKRENPTRDSDTEDVEMADPSVHQEQDSESTAKMAAHNGAAASLDGTRSRAETPLSAASGADDTGNSRVPGRSDPPSKPTGRPGLVAGPAMPPVVRKRPAPSPFIPKKKR